MSRPSLPLSGSRSLATRGQHPLTRSRTVRDACAALTKSAEIILRSSRVWSSTLFGLSSMTMDEAFNAARARLSCTTLTGLVELERDIEPRMVASAFSRFCMLLIMAVQIGEEARYPLRRWIVAELENFAPSLGA